MSTSLPPEEYWEQRALEDAKERINQTEDFIEEYLKKLYAECSEELEKEITDFYKKYAKEEAIDITEAKKRISKATFENVNWEELVHRAKETGDEGLKKQVTTLSYKGQITRLELLNLDIASNLSKLYNAEQISVYEYLVDTYVDGYYKSIHNLQSYYQIKTDFAKLPSEAINKAVTQSWHGKNFSERIWGHRQDLEEDLRKTISKAITKGHSIDRTARSMEKDMQVAFSDAKRLVRTESNYVHNQATKESYERAGIEQYEFLATLDFKTSKACQDLDGKVFNLKDAKVGANYPPIHPNCRSVAVPYFEDTSVGMRTAKKADGKTYRVRSDLTYKEWFESLTEEEKTAIELERKKAKNFYADKEQLAKYKKTLGKDAPRNFEQFTEMKYGNEYEYSLLKKNYSFKNNLNNDRINLQVRKQKQQEHILGTRQWKQRVKTSAGRNEPLPTYFNKNVDVQKLINGYHGKGVLKFNRNDIYPREYVNVKNVVGRYYDREARKYIDAKRIAIHYSGKGVHAYPVVGGGYD